MFESRAEIAAAVDAVYAILDTLQRGDVLRHDQVREAIGLRPHEGSWDHIVYRAFDLLRENKGIAFWHVRTVGYELLTPARTLEVIPLKRVKKAYRQLRRVERDVEALPERELTLQQRRLRLFELDRVKERKVELRREHRALALLIRPTATLPRRPVAAE
jgi:hypothetical protein